MSDAMPACVEPFRALTVFEDIPPGHKAVRVHHESFAPHVRVGEIAIVDTLDKEVQDGELYMFWISGRDRRHLRIVQPYRPHSPRPGVMFRFSLPVAGRLCMVDGPLGFEHWPEACLGRIVGVFEPIGTRA
jgi:hypothetical protein